MANLTNDRHYRQLLSTSLAYRSSDIQDLVFNSTPISAILRDRGAFKPYYGPEIRQTLMVDKLQAQWFTGYDKLKNEPKEIAGDAVWTPKRVAVGFSLNGTEILANQGRAQIHDLVETYMENAEESMQDAWETALVGSGTADGGRQMIGLGGAVPIIPNTGVYGGINRGDHAIWRTSTFDAASDFLTIGAGWDSTTARPILENIVGQRSKGSRYAQIAIADLNAYQAMSASMVAHQRIVEDRGAARKVYGFAAPLVIQTPAGPVDFYCARGVGNVMPSDTVFGLDLRGLNIRYHPNNNMVPLFPGEGAKPVNQDAIAQYLVWTGEMTVINPRYTWRLIATPPTP